VKGRKVEKIVRSVCQACHCECGVLVHVRDGKVTKIEGDPEHLMNRGYICVKGRAQPELIYHPDRLKYPMRRVGERGSGKWERIPWDEALNGIAGKLTETRNKYGAESFAAIHGTGPRPTNYSTSLLALALGSPNVISVDLHICFLPSVVAEAPTYGETIMMESGPDYFNSSCIMVVGANPVVSHPARGAEILEAKRKRRAKLIVIDPRRTELASKADIWLQVRPGTDVALALGMIKVIIDEGLYDKEFVNTWCYGFEKLEERVKEYPVDKVAEITWVPTEKIKQAARLYATTKPAVLHHRVAVEQNINSTQTDRALAIMIALTGNIDVPGGNLFSMSTPGIMGNVDLSGYDRKFRLGVEADEKRIGAKEHPLISGPAASVPFVLAPLAHKALSLGKPYPINALFCGGGNPVLNMQNVKSVWQAIKNNLELFVVADFFMTPTAELADYVLPAATWLERDDLCEMMYTNYVSARQKVIEPLGECWHDMKMTMELVKRIPWANKKALPWNDVDEFNEALVKEAGITFKELKEKSCLIVPMKYKKYKKEGFKTPTRKVELYSTYLEQYGYDPLPFYREPLESPVSTPELIKDYPFILYTGGRHIEFFHSEGRQIPALRTRVPDPLVEMHPETANRLKIQDGDWVWIETPQVKGERVRLRAKLTDSVHPEMVHARHAWWFPEKPAPEHGCFESNISVVLTDDPPREEICSSVRTRGTLCRIYREG
jgi:anaerobic selenocysteine-containing dehydrogenase